MTIHVEAVSDPRPVLDKIRSLGALAGLAVNPPTPLSAIEASLPHCDLVLVMSVMPGFGGQEFEDEAIEKLRELAARKTFTPCEKLMVALVLERLAGVPKRARSCLSRGRRFFAAATTQAVDRLRSTANLALK